MQRIRGWAHLFVTGCRNLQKNGIRDTLYRTRLYLEIREGLPYIRWERANRYTEQELQEQRERSFDREITFSILTPLYNTPADWLREMIESVTAQTYDRWELCLADGSDPDHAYVGEICREYAAGDNRIRYRKLEKNLGIAGNSNACVEMASGDYLSLLDHDDVLHPAALYEVMDRICSLDADFIYTDEATFRSPDREKIQFIHFKPDYAPDNLLANNYICHFTSFRRSLIDRCGAFREGYDGSQDHELVLRLTAAAHRIEHIPKVLYYLRASPQSAAESSRNKPYAAEAGIRAVSDYLKDSGIRASVEPARENLTIYRVHYELQSACPGVSIIIPTRDHESDLRTCIRSIWEKTTYTNYEIILVENGSKDPGTLAYYKELSEQEPSIRVLRWQGDFNWSAINNFAVRNAPGQEYLLFLNNDTEVITPTWIEEMLMHAQRPGVAAVGAMLYYPNDTIQHAGVILGLNKTVAHAFEGTARGKSGYIGRLLYAQNYSAVTGACMMVRRSVWEELGGFDETYSVCYNDVDFCLRAGEAGYRIIWTPHAELYHHESRTRDRQVLPEEEQHLLDRWGWKIEKGDPYYSPSFSLLNGRFMIKNENNE